MTQVERMLRMIEFGYFDFFGLGTEVRAAERALEAAARIDAAPDLDG
jgi:hypothetical protein